MAPERRLIPLEDNLPTANTTRIICTANVVGVIPPKIHDILTITPPPELIRCSSIFTSEEVICQ